MKEDPHSPYAEFMEFVNSFPGSVHLMKEDTFYYMFQEAQHYVRDARIRNSGSSLKENTLTQMKQYYASAGNIVPGLSDSVGTVSWGYLRDLQEHFSAAPWVVWLLMLRMEQLGSI